MKTLIVLILMAITCPCWANPVFLGTSGGVTAAGGGGTISYGSSASNNTPTQNPVVDKPTGTAEGSFLLAIIVGDLNNSSTVTSTGWTPLRDIPSNSSSLTSVLYKVAGASEPATYTFESDDTLTIAMIARFEKTGGTWNIADSSEVAADGDITTASVTATDNSMLVVCFGSDDNISLTAGPPDMTQIDLLTGGNVGAAMWYESRSAGAVTKLIDDSTTTANNTAIAVILNLL